MVGFVSVKKSSTFVTTELIHIAKGLIHNGLDYYIINREETSFLPLAVLTLTCVKWRHTNLVIDEQAGTTRIVKQQGTATT